MSLKDAVDELVGGATPDAQSARAAMIDKLRQARHAFEADRHDGPGGRWLTTDGPERVSFSPTRPDGQQLVIGGQSVTFWHPNELPAVLDAFEAAIAAGEMDPQLVGGTPAGHSLPRERIAPAAG